MSVNKSQSFLEAVFSLLGAAVLVAALLEAFWPGIILSLFNPAWLLIFWLFAGMVLLLAFNRRDTYF